MALPNIGPLELVLILAVLLILVGPRRLPEMGQSVGRAIREFRKASSEVVEATSLSPTPARPVAPASPAMAATAAVVAPESVPVSPPPPVASPTQEAPIVDTAPPTASAMVQPSSDDGNVPPA